MRKLEDGRGEGMVKGDIDLLLNVSGWGRISMILYAFRGHLRRVGSGIKEAQPRQSTGPNPLNSSYVHLQ